MSKNRKILWVILLVCTVVEGILLAVSGSMDASFGFIYTIGKKVLFYIDLCLLVVLVGSILKNKTRLDRSSVVVLSVVIVFLIGMGIIFYGSQKRVDQMLEDSGTVAAVEHTAISADTIGLVSSGKEIIDRGESHWKSWLDYTVMLENGGSLQYNCERYTDAEDAKGRLENYVASDSTGKEWKELLVQEPYEGVDRIEAYEWVTEGDGTMGVFFYYFLSEDMVLGVKLRNPVALDETQCKALSQWLLTGK